MAAHCETTYTSTACNRSPGCVSWGSNNLIIFGSCNAVSVYDPKEEKITQTLSLHSSWVNCVRWVKKLDKHAVEDEFVSASSDKTAAVWSRNLQSAFVPFILKGHDDILTEIDGIYLPTEEKIKSYQPLLVATASGDSSVKIWFREPNKVDVTQNEVLSLRSGLCVGLRLWLLPTTNTPLLAIANDDGKILLYSRFSGNFSLVHRLLGHDDWVRSIDFAIHDNGDVLIASGSQDTYIRIWRLSPRESTNSERQEPSSAKTEIKLEEDVFCISEKNGQKEFWAATLDSVLAGHEGWVFTVCWHPSVLKEDGSTNQPLSLLSASIDKSMILWSLDVDETDCVWLEKARVGEVGGNTLGFYGCQFSPNGHSILAHGYQGSFHLWHQCDDDHWKPGVIVSGHFGEVTDIDWDPNGDYVISVSKDQTARLHAPWVRRTEENCKITWHEIARPQVHGHEIQCLAVNSRFTFVSGGEEKVFRYFTATTNFLENFYQICGLPLDRKILDSIPRGAAVPALGLSNKPVFEEGSVNTDDQTSKEGYPEFHFRPIKLTEPPTEETLLQNTVWPEMQKVYGHGYDMYSLAASHSGAFVASACKASSTQHAAIIMWQLFSSQWKQVQKLTTHDLTVTQMAFSPGDQFFLSVSRDRRWCLFEREHNGDGFVLISSLDKRNPVHTRIIWCCTWTQDANFFATGSRDGRVAVWGPVNSHCEIQDPASCPLNLKDSVTSLAFSPQDGTSTYHLAVGLESGYIFLYDWVNVKSDEPWTLALTLNHNDAHHLTVHRLKFRPRLGAAGVHDKNLNCLQLASAGADHIVKVFTLQVKHE